MARRVRQGPLMVHVAPYTAVAKLFSAVRDPASQSSVLCALGCWSYGNSPTGTSVLRSKNQGPASVRARCGARRRISLCTVTDEDQPLSPPSSALDRHSRAAGGHGARKGRSGKAGQEEQHSSCSGRTITCRTQCCALVEGQWVCCGAGLEPASDCGGWW